MKTVGEVLRSAREKQGKKLAQVTRETKIKEKFLQALEENNLALLPSLPTAMGFARSFAQVVGASPSQVAALLRRDFPEFQSRSKKEEIPLVRSIWTPKTTIFATFLVSGLALSVYLLRQYILFAGPPHLEIVRIASEEGAVVLSGKTNPSATVEVNGNRVLVSEDGSFTFQSAAPETGSLEVRAVSRSGKETTVRRQISD